MDKMKRYWTHLAPICISDNACQFRCVPHLLKIDATIATIYEDLISMSTEALRMKCNVTAFGICYSIWIEQGGRMKSCWVTVIITHHERYNLSDPQCIWGGQALIYQQYQRKVSHKRTNPLTLLIDVSVCKKLKHELLTTILQADKLH